MSERSRLRSRHVWRAVAAVVAVVIGVGVYAVVRAVSSGGTVTAASGRYAFEIPEGWARCDGSPLRGSDIVQDGCVRPDGPDGAGVYFVSMANRTEAATVLGTLSGEVAGYTTCSEVYVATEEEPSDVACLQSTSDPQQKGEMRVRMFGSTVVAQVCLRTDQPDVEEGCDAVWARVRLAG